MERIFVKPKGTFRVPDLQDGGYYPADGKWADKDMYVARRLLTDELVEANPAKVKPKEQQPELVAGEKGKDQRDAREQRARATAERAFVPADASAAASALDPASTSITSGAKPLAKP